MITFRRTSALTLAALLLGTSCATSAHLVASDGSHRLVARDAPTGLTAVITTAAWIGDAEIARDFTVIHILIDNRGTEPVLLAPGDFELRDSRGFLYRLQDAGGTFKPATTGDSSVAGSDNYDPGGDFPYEQVAATDPDFARAALPWGVLEPGTQMRGFLYFEPIVQTANQGFLVWHAQTPEHQALANLGFEVHVARVRLRER